ncbi:hypothetical protein ACV1EH_00710 [Aeromonas caviae]
MDPLNDQAALDANQQGADNSPELDVFAQASNAADARLRGESSSDENQQQQEEDEDQQAAGNGDEQQPQQGAAPAQQAAADHEALFSNASPEQKAYLQSLIADRDKQEQSARSANGRYAASQRQLAETQRQFEERMAARQAGGAGDGEAAAKLTALEERIAAMREDYPDLADHMKGIATELRGEISQATKPVAELRQQAELARQQELIAIETDELTRRHPDAIQIVQDPAFQAWVAQQPASVQRIANSDYAADADVALTLYKATQLQAQRQADAQRQQARQRKLGDMAPLPTSQGRATVDTSDESSLFDREAREADQRLTQRKY